MQKLLMTDNSSDFNLAHLRGMVTVGYFRAPAEDVRLGRTIGGEREEIELLTGGCGYFEINRRIQPVGCGCMLWHLPGEQTIHLNELSNPYECITLVFPVRGKPRRRVPRVTFWEDPAEAKQFARELLSVYHRDDVDRSLLAAYAYSRTLLQARLYATRRQEPGMPRKVQQALEYMNRHWGQLRSLDEVAAAAQTSVPHLHFLFRTHLKTTPHQFVMKKRLQEARHMLATTGLLVKEVAFRCGFPDTVNFCRAFRARFGTTPAAYRDRHNIELQHGGGKY